MSNTIKRVQRAAVLSALCAVACSDEESQRTKQTAIDTAGIEERRITTHLMNGWRFTQNDGLSDDQALQSNGQDWETVSLPHTWNAEDAASLQSVDYKRGLGWYRLEFPTPENGARHWLEFGAASLVAEVWLNGERLGQHKGAFTQFRFDVTEELNENGINTLLVKVDNSDPETDNDLTAIPPKGGDFNIFGGLYRHVALISTPALAHFALGDMGASGVYASTTSIPGGDAGAATVNVRAKVANDADSTGQYTLRVSLVDAAGDTAAEVSEPVELDARGGEEVTLELSVQDPHLWQGVEDPYMYQLVADLVDADDTAVDRVVQPFGIREIRIDPEEGLFLNGRHLRLRGAAMHQDFLGKGWAMTEQDMDASLALFGEMGANAIRLGHYPFSQYALERVSELGLIAWSEAALGIRTRKEQCSREDPTEDFVESAHAQLREMIRQLYNYPAVFTWAVGNESTQGHINCDDPYDNVTPLLRALHETAKEEDPGRPTSYAEFPHPVDETRVGPLATENITDIFATNRYFLWYTPDISELGPLLDDLRARAPDQPLGVSEYGAGAALTHHTDDPSVETPEIRSAPEGEVSYQPEEYAAYAHEQNYRVLSSRPYLYGTFIWNMFDFGSAHRNEGDVLGVNTKGLVTFDRQTRKDPFFFYKANWSTEPVTYIVGRRYTERAYPVADVKVYSNAETLELFVNGTSVATRPVAECEQHTCVFEDVRLAPGQNEIRAVGRHGGTEVVDTVAWTSNNRDFNIAAGRLATGYVSSNDTLFGSDHFFEDGRGTFIVEGEDPVGGLGDIEGAGGVDVSGTDDPALYKYLRRGEFRYRIPVEPGRYTVTLSFLEPDDDISTGERVFSVRANGQPLLTDFDVRREAGGTRQVLTREFTLDVDEAPLVIEFTPSQGEAVISNLKVTAAPPAAP